MSKRLNDGTILPSNLSLTGLTTGRQLFSEDFSLKVGVVTEIIYPDDKASLSKKVIEYNVVTSDVNKNGNVNLGTYRNCIFNNRFGMSNNNETYTLQADQSDDAKATFASIVMLLCISGQSSGGQAVIIGGLSHPNGPAYTSANGQFYDFNFNGINYNINKDGEWTLTFNSPIDKDGNQANKDAAGTKVKIDKDGRLSISDNAGQSFTLDRAAQNATWTNGNDSIIIDQKNKKVAITSSGEFNLASQKATSINSSDAISISSKQDTSISSGANLNTESKGNFGQKSGGNWEVNASGNVNVKAGGNVMIQGGAQAQMKAAINMIGDGSVPVAAVGVSMVIGVGNIGSPVVSQILTGSSTVLVGT